MENQCEAIMKNNIIKSLLLQAIIFTVLFATMLYLTESGHIITSGLMIMNCRIYYYFAHRL